MIRVPESPAKRKAFVAGLVVVLLACAGWIVYSVLPGPGVRPTNEIVLAPDVKEAKDLTAELQKDPRFVHLELARIDEATWSCMGEVKRGADIAPAKARAEELKPGVQWKFEIVSMQP